jgi:hypothetical protein
MLYGFGLALAAGLWPVGLTAILAYLDRGPPLRAAYAYLAGALVMVALVTVVALAGLSALDAAPRDRASLDGGVTLALGVLALALAAALWWWLPRPHHPPVRTPERDRRPGARAAFALGFAMWLPSPVYLAALKAIKDTGAGTTAIALSAVVAVVLFLWIVEVPILCYLVAPATTGRRLGAANRWLRRNGRAIVVLLTGAIGVALTVEGLARLLH